MDNEAAPGSYLLRSELAGRRRTSSTESAAPTDKARRISQLFQKNSLRDELTRVAASDPSLKLLDLSGSTRFMSLTAVQKGQAIGLLAQGHALETLVLNSLRLDNASAGAVADVLRHNNSLLSVSLEGNSLTEEGLIAIAAGVEGHPALCELTVANQRAPLSNAAVAALLQAMEGTPSLLKLGLGALRDNGARWRLQAATMRNTERMRQQRQRRGSFDPEPADGRDLRRSISFGSGVAARGARAAAAITSCLGGGGGGGGGRAYPASEGGRGMGDDETHGRRVSNESLATRIERLAPMVAGIVDEPYEARSRHSNPHPNPNAKPNAKPKR
jgi:hypothetical protein